MLNNISCLIQKYSMGGLKIHIEIVNKTKGLQFVYKISQMTKVKL